MIHVSRIKNQILIILMVWFIGIGATTVSAHVVVEPSEVGVGKFQTFTIGVPVEKDLPVTGMRLVIPEGLNYVSPNVKPGWTINIKRSGEDKEAKVTEITWTGGSIPTGFRDEFLFSAQVPTEAGAINWKAYQTYGNGEVVAWEQDPNAPKPSLAPGGDDDGGVTPYSVTKVVNDLAAVPKAETVNQETEEGENLPLILSALAVIFSGFALGIALKKH